MLVSSVAIADSVAPSAQRRRVFFLFVICALQGLLAALRFVRPPILALAGGGAVENALAGAARAQRRRGAAVGAETLVRAVRTQVDGLKHLVDL